MCWARHPPPQLSLSGPAAPSVKGPRPAPARRHPPARKAAKRRSRTGTIVTSSTMSTLSTFSPRTAPSASSTGGTRSAPVSVTCVRVSSLGLSVPSSTPSVATGSSTWTTASFSMPVALCWTPLLARSGARKARKALGPVRVITTRMERAGAGEPMKRLKAARPSSACIAGDSSLMLAREPTTSARAPARRAAATASEPWSNAGSSSNGALGGRVQRGSANATRFACVGFATRATVAPAGCASPVAARASQQGRGSAAAQSGRTTRTSLTRPRRRCE
mmetsp:Transcript_70180/g.156338  ORF Transcript_70180/g.156338 Transcript_70180/m.156338 type:complete len:277 (-) Transcript_70180:218-1048(-)